MANPNGAKGARAERLVADYLKASGFPYADRRVKTGAKDTGDIGGVPCVIEVKNCRTAQLAGWLDEAVAEAANAKVSRGVVWHHRAGKGKPEDWYVTMRGQDFVAFLRSWGGGAHG
jgi:hypothetical protein